MHTLRYVHMLGPMQILHGGQPFPLKYNKARGLLAYLAQQPGFHTRVTLADLLWPGDSGQGGRDKLKRMLFHVREAMGNAAIEATRQVVRLDASGHAWHDTQTFAALIEEGRQSLFQATQATDRAALKSGLAALCRAVDLYRGPFMQGLMLDDAPAFENWLAGQRADYASRRIYALRLLADGYRQLGDIDSAVHHARQLVALAPRDEAGSHHLIALLGQIGQHNEAAAELARLREVLSRERSIDSGAQTETLPQNAPAAPAVSGGTEERRQITVVACDLTIRAGNDPDLWVAALRQPLEDCEKKLRETAGYTVRSPAGGLLAYFGYPAAIEGAARRAVDTAMACRRVATGAVRIGLGIHTGIVISSTQGGMPDSAGQVSRFATSLSELARAGEVLLSEDTLKLAERDLHDLRFGARGTLRERHGERDIVFYSVPPVTVHETSPGAPPPAPGRNSGKPLAGRRDELAWLDAARAAAMAATRPEGTPVCLLLGDAGIGKTHLVQYFRGSRSVPGVDLQCRREASGTPFHPFATWLRQAAPQLATEPLSASAAASLAALNQLLAGDGAGGNIGGNPPDPMPVAGNWKETVVAHLLGILDACVPRGGMVFCDDAHWADPSTQDVLAALAERPLPNRLLAVAARPPFHPPWRQAGSVQYLGVDPLASDEAVALVASLAPPGALPAEMQQRIAALSDGVPLFAEELTLDRLAAGTGHQATSATDDAAPMPASLHDLLMSRIDAAGPAKPVAQLAATMGVEFTASLLAATGLVAASLTSALAALAANRLIVSLEQDRYRFRHALLRRAAYESQTREARRAAHAVIARALASEQPALATREPETLAWHYSRAGDSTLACQYLVAAGEKAAQRAAYRESATHYRAALALLDQQPDTPELRIEQLRVHMALGVSAVALYGNGSAAVRHIFQDALRLAESLGDDARLFPVYWGLWLGSSSWADFGQSVTLAHTLVRIATAQGDAAWQAHAHYALGNSLCCHGDFADAARALETAVSVFHEDDADRGLGEDALVTAWSFLSWIHWLLGRHDEALSASDAALSRARGLDQPYSLLFALVFAAILRRWRQDVAAAEAFATEAVNLAREFGMALWEAAGQTVKGWARAQRGDRAGIDEITASMSHLNDIMGGVEAIFLGHLVEACAAVGDTGIGTQAVERALQVSRKRLDRHWVPEFLRAKAEMLLAAGKPAAEGRGWLVRALQAARQLDSPSLILRAAASLARHDLAAGHDAAEATGALSHALSRISGGDELGEIRAARELLRILNSWHRG